MCGLVGVVNRDVGTKSVALDKAFEQMLYCDSLRGIHGTGMLLVSQSGNEEIYKKALPAHDFLDLARTKALLNKSSIFLCGHNRYATHGAHTTENAHPFNHGDITLFHNGTLSNWKHLTKGDFTVDSEYLTSLLDKTDSSLEILNEIDGAYSLVWYDSYDKTLNFARNDERPMYFGKVKDSNSFLYASEPGLIRWIASRNNIELESITPSVAGLQYIVHLDAKLPTKTKPFTPKEVPEYDYTNYYQSRGNYKQSWKEKKVEPTNKSVVLYSAKNNHLIGSTERYIEGGAWEAYAPNAQFGKIVGKYLKKLDVKVSGIVQSMGLVCQNKPLIVTITAAPSDTEVIATLVRVANPDDIALNTVSRNSLGIFNAKCSICDSSTVSDKNAIKDSDGLIYCGDCVYTYSEI